MKYLVCQHYDKIVYDKNRELPWMKMFTALLAPTKDLAYSELPDITKALLHHLWLMAIVWKNRIPADWITKDKLNLKTKLSLDPILDAGYVWWADSDGNRILDSLVRERDARQKSFSKIRTEEKQTARELVESFELLPKHREHIAAKWPSVPADEELSAWKDRMRSNGYLVGKNPVRDPQAAFYTSCRMAERWGTYVAAGAKRVAAKTDRPLISERDELFGSKS